MRLIFSFVILFFFFTVRFTEAQGEWIKIDSPAEDTLLCIFAYDSLNVWVGGDSGTIMYSSDWGVNWNVQTADGIYLIKDIHFIDSLNGWAIGTSIEPPFTMLYHTVNGGNNWDAAPFQEELLALRTVFFLDTLTGYIAGSSGALYKTTDAGFKWTEASVDSYRIDMNDIQFIDEFNGAACGGIRDLTGVIWRSSDAGESWSAILIPYEPVWELYFFDSLNMIGVGGDLEFGTAIIRSTDGGYTWDYNSLSIFGVGTSIDFRNNNEAWCTLGSDLRLIYSADTGYTWTSFPSPENSALYDLVFADSLHGMAVGLNGAVFKYKKKLVNVDDDNSYSPGSFYVYQNYPNPFNPSTRIDYYIPESAPVYITITDILGNNVYSVTAYNDAGKNSYYVNMRIYPSGIYFYSVLYKNILQTGKMIYLK